MCVSTSVDTLPKVSGGQEAHECGYILGFALYATHPFLEDPVMGQGSYGIMEASLPCGGGSWKHWLLSNGRSQHGLS